MKKLIALFMAMALIFALVLPVSAATTMHWDWGKAQSSIGKAISEIVQEQQTEPAETTEPVDDEYIAVEETVAVAENSSAAVPVIQPVHEKMQSWRDWLHALMNRLYYGEG